MTGRLRSRSRKGTTSVNDDLDVEEKLSSPSSPPYPLRRGRSRRTNPSTKEDVKLDVLQKPSSSLPLRRGRSRRTDELSNNHDEKLDVLQKPASSFPLRRGRSSRRRTTEGVSSEDNGLDLHQRLSSPSPPRRRLGPPPKDSTSASRVSSSSSSFDDDEKEEEDCYSSPVVEMSPSVVVEEESITISIPRQLPISNESNDVNSHVSTESKNGIVTEETEASSPKSKDSLEQKVLPIRVLALPPNSVVDCLEYADSVNQLVRDDSAWSLLPPKKAGKSQQKNQQQRKKRRGRSRTKNQILEKTRMKDDDKNGDRKPIRKGDTSSTMASIVSIPKARSTQGEIFLRFQKFNSLLLRPDNLSSSLNTEEDVSAYMLYRWMRTRIGAGMVRSSIVMLQKMLAEGYGKAGYLLQKVEEDEFSDHIHHLIDLRKRLAGLWCIYAHTIIEVGQHALWEKAADLSVAQETKPPSGTQTSGKRKRSSDRQSPVSKKRGRPSKQRQLQQIRPSPSVLFQVPPDSVQTTIESERQHQDKVAEQNVTQKKGNEEHTHSKECTNGRDTLSLIGTVSRVVLADLMRSIDEALLFLGWKIENRHKKKNYFTPGEDWGSRTNRLNTIKGVVEFLKTNPVWKENETVKRALVEFDAGIVKAGRPGVTRPKPKWKKSHGRGLRTTPGARSPIRSSKGKRQIQIKSSSRPKTIDKSPTTLQDVINHAMSILLAARKCLLVGDSTLITMSIGRLIVSGTVLTTRTCENGASQDLSSATVLPAISTAILSCWDAIDICQNKHNANKRLQMKENPWKSIDFLSDHEFHCRPIQKEVRVSSHELKSSLESVLDLPAQIAQQIESKNTIFCDRNTVRSLCEELNRLSRLKENIANDMGVVISGSGRGDASDTLLDSLKMFAPFDTNRSASVFETKNGKSRVVGIESAAKEYMNDKCPRVKTIVWNW